MSHMAVLVVTKEAPDEAVLASVLQPWHEYECTGVDDQYVIDVDVTDRLMSEWAGPAKAVRLADGTVLCRYDEKLYFDIGKINIGRPEREFRLPEGAAEIEIPQSELSAAKGETLEQFAKDYGGWEKKADGRFYDHTNPNHKWDWWSIGGRYAGWLCTKDGGETDVARVGDLDLPRMLIARKRQRRDWIAECCEKSGLPESDLEIACHEQGPAHDDWLALPEPRPRGAEYTAWLAEQGGRRAIYAKARSACWDIPSLNGKSISEWVESAPPLTAFAIVKDGRWVEKGNMGWFGVVSDEKDDASWEAEFRNLFAALSDDEFIAIVDCHT